MDELRPNLQGLFTITFHSKGISEAEIRKDFSQFGRIAELKNSGYGRVFVKYRKREEAEASLAFPMGKYGSIQPARSQQPNTLPIEGETFNLASRDARPAPRSPRRDETSSYHKQQEGNKQVSRAQSECRGWSYSLSVQCEYVKEMAREAVCAATDVAYLDLDFMHGMPTENVQDISKDAEFYKGCRQVDTIHTKETGSSLPRDGEESNLDVIEPGTKDGVGQTAPHVWAPGHMMAGPECKPHNLRGTRKSEKEQETFIDLSSEQQNAESVFVQDKTEPFLKETDNNFSLVPEGVRSGDETPHTWRTEYRLPAEVKSAILQSSSQMLVSTEVSRDSVVSLHDSEHEPADLTKASSYLAELSALDLKFEPPQLAPPAAVDESAAIGEDVFSVDYLLKLGAERSVRDAVSPATDDLPEGDREETAVSGNQCTGEEVNVVDPSDQDWTADMESFVWMRTEGPDKNWVRVRRTALSSVVTSIGQEELRGEAARSNAACPAPLPAAEKLTLPPDAEVLPQGLRNGDTAKPCCGGEAPAPLLADENNNCGPELKNATAAAQTLQTRHCREAPATAAQESSAHPSLQRGDIKHIEAMVRSEILVKKSREESVRTRRAAAEKAERLKRLSRQAKGAPQSAALKRSKKREIVAHLEQFVGRAPPPHGTDESSDDLLEEEHKQMILSELNRFLRNSAGSPRPPAAPDPAVAKPRVDLFQDPPLTPRGKVMPRFQQLNNGPGTSPLHLTVSLVPQEKPACNTLPSYSEMMKEGRPKDFYSLAADDECEDTAADAATAGQWDSDAADVEPKKRATVTATGLKRSKSFVDRPMQNRFADASSPQVSSSAGAARRRKEEKTPARSSCNNNTPKASVSGMQGADRNRARTRTVEPVAPDQGRYDARAKSCHRSYDERRRGSPERTPAAATVRPRVSFDCDRAKPTSPRDAAHESAAMPGLAGEDAGPPPLVCGARPRPRPLRLVDIPDPEREIIAVNVPPGVRSADVWQVFQRFGPCRVSPLGETPLGLPYCFVRFAAPEQAMAAMELDDVEFEGCYLLLRRVCDAKRRLQASY